MKHLNKLVFISILVLSFIGCQSEDGENGAPGLNSLTVFSKEGSGPDCKFGGLKIEAGLDSNANLILDSDEIHTTKYACDGIEDPITKEIRIVLHNNNSGSSGTFGNYINNYPAIIKFDKGSWSNLSSVIYTANIKSDNSNNSAIVDLYNRTDFEVIPNSTLTTRSTEFANIISDNLMDYLPNKEIDIYLRLRSENNTGDNVWISNKSELIIRQEK